MIKHEISNIIKNSIADEMGISRGDFLLSINGEEVRDVLDYRFRISESHLVVEIESQKNAEIWELDIEKDPDEDLGIEFKQSLMSHTRRCRNKCVFCFVDQQPKGLRNTLYVKDDDARLSFLLGNYVTLTNLSEAEVKRLAGYHLSPLRISVHAADLDMRAKMMGTDAARNLFDALEAFNRAGIEMHFQIVLCRGLNDGKQLEYTIEKLIGIKPGAQSLAIVPAGLTKHRDGLFELQPFTKHDAIDVIEQVGRFTEEAGCSGFVFLSDEWYILAEKPLPNYKYYENFPQLDNGVGVVRLFERGFMKGIKGNRKLTHSGIRGLVHYVYKIMLDSRPRARMVSTGRDKFDARAKMKAGIITGKAAGGLMRSIADRFMAKHPGVQVSVYVIDNEFFGSTVTVSGLLAGQDVIAQLKNRHRSDVLFLPENAFRSGVKQKIMLDGVTLKTLEKELDAKVVIGSTDGLKFYKQLAALILCRKH